MLQEASEAKANGEAGDELASVSLLRKGLPFEELSLDASIHTVESNLRHMCRAMAAFANDIDMSREGFDAMQTMLNVFVEYVDVQMDGLSRLRRLLERDFSDLSPARLRRIPDLTRAAARAPVATPPGMRPVAPIENFAEALGKAFAAPRPKARRRG